jgi:hypothetical protein
MVWDMESGNIYPRALSRKPSHGKALKAPIKRIGEQAEILGKWFSKHDLVTIEAYLKVVF